MQLSQNESSKTGPATPPRQIIEVATTLPPSLVAFFSEAFSESYDLGLGARIPTPPAHVYSSLETFFQATRIAQRHQRNTRDLTNFSIEVRAFRVPEQELRPRQIEPALWVPLLFPWDVVAYHARLLASEKPETERSRRVLKFARIAVKIARNIFYGFSESGIPPDHLNRVSASLGRLNDALTGTLSREKVPALASIVLRALRNFEPQRLRSQLRLAPAEEIVERMVSHARTLGTLDLNRRMEHEELHHSKKVSIGLLNFYRLLYVAEFDTDPWRLPALTSLAVFNDQLGRLVEKSLRRRAENGLVEDDPSRVKLPRDLRRAATLLSIAIQLGLRYHS